MTGFQKNIILFINFQGVESSKLHNFFSSLFLAKCIKHLVLYIMNNPISHAYGIDFLKEKSKFYEGKEK
jgi:hypothetical protein